MPQMDPTDWFIMFNLLCFGVLFFFILMYYFIINFNLIKNMILNKIKKLKKFINKKFKIKW